MDKLKKGCIVIHKHDKVEYEFSQYEENEYSSVRADLFPLHRTPCTNKKVIYVRPVGSEEEFESMSADEFLAK